MDEHRESAWEDIGGCVQRALTTVSAPRPALPSLCSDPLTRPATEDDFRNELTACLALVAPVGMDENARREWLMVAWDSLRHLPTDLLRAGCRKARLIADHPAKIVPAIIAETEEDMARRTRIVLEYGAALPGPKTHIMDRDRRHFTAEDWDELNQHLELVGSPVRYRSDGTRYEADEPGSG